jgi:hypothetical protein
MAVMDRTPEQRRAITRTAVLLGLVALAFYLFTVFGGWW